LLQAYCRPVGGTAWHQIFFCSTINKRFQHSLLRFDCEIYFFFRHGIFITALQVSGLDVCTSLIRLDLSDNQLTTNAIAPVAALPNLKWLSIANNNVKCIKCLQSLGTLEVLNASHNEIEGKVSVGRMTELKALVLSNNKIQTVGGLEKLRKLDTLILSHNSLSSLGGWIAGATSLQKLSVSHNPLHDEAATAGLNGLISMKELRMNHCQLSNVPSAILCMKKLQILEMGSNLISKFENLKVLESVQSMWQLNLKGCPVVQKDGYKQRILDLVPRVDVLDTKRIRPKGGRGKRPRLTDADASIRSPAKEKKEEPQKISKDDVHVATAVADAMHKSTHTSLPADEDDCDIQAEAFRPSKLTTGQVEKSTRTCEDRKTKKIKGAKLKPASSKAEKQKEDDESQGPKVSLRGKAAVLADQKTVLSGWT